MFYDVIVGCECSGKVRDAFRARGLKAISVDTQDTDAPGPHHRGDLFDFLDGNCCRLFICHPPCTFVCNSGLHWNKRVPGRAAKTEAALEFFIRCDTWLGAKQSVMENPMGCISTRYRKYQQTIQPYQFGDDASKLTCLWLRNVDPLVIPDKQLWYPPRLVEYKGKEVKRWSNQTDSGQNKLPPSAQRAKLRSETYPGIANAFAAAWC